MRRSCGRALILFMCLFSLLACQPKPLKVKDYLGHEVVLGDGRWLVINYWATWCHACLKEMPDLVALQARYPTEVQVVGVSFDALDQNQLQAFADQYQINFPLLSRLDYQQWGVKSLPTVPTTLVINPEGHLEAVEIQPRTLAQWQKQLRLNA